MTQKTNVMMEMILRPTDKMSPYWSAHNTDIKKMIEITFSTTAYHPATRAPAFRLPQRPLSYLRLPIVSWIAY